MKVLIFIFLIFFKEFPHCSLYVFIYSSAREGSNIFPMVCRLLDSSYSWPAWNGTAAVLICCCTTLSFSCVPILCDQRCKYYSGASHIPGILPGQHWRAAAFLPMYLWCEGSCFAAHLDSSVGSHGLQSIFLPSMGFTTRVHGVVPLLFSDNEWCWCIFHVFVANSCISSLRKVRFAILLIVWNWSCRKLVVFWD